jgi:phosphopantetheine--protein transferase-like protein
LADRDGKPYVQDARVAISISHSETALAVAVAGTGPIGVDIEDVSTAIEAQQIADHFFHPYEAAQLRKLDQPDRDLAFLFSWTLKEAALKATGAGLRAPLSSVRAAVSCCQQRNVSLAVTRTLPWPEPPSVGRTFRLESICGAAAGPVRRWRILRKVALTRACRVEPVVDVK